MLPLLPALALAAAHPVAVVELFTSEGCSSCPPADAVLSELARDPRVIALGFHVDYWDGLGWKDPLSSPQASARQHRYARALARGDYTPQMVVNGRAQLIGSDGDAARAAVKRALAAPAAVDVELSRAGDTLSWKLDKPAPGAALTVALVIDDVVHRIPRGENAGRTLHHDRAVRSVTTSTLSSTATSGTAPLEEASAVVVLLQDPSSLAILGAAQLRL